MAASKPKSVEEALQEELACPICLEVFSDPVMIVGCWHNFCRLCLDQYWKGALRDVSCPQCRAAFPEARLEENRQLRNVAQVARRIASPSPQGSPQESPQGPLCALHQEPLELFCQDQGRPLCVACDQGKAHRRPLQEAHQALQGEEEIAVGNQLADISGEEASSGGGEMSGSYNPQDAAASPSMTSCWRVTPARMEEFPRARLATSWEYGPLHSTGSQEVQELRQELVQVKELFHLLLLRDYSNPRKKEATLKLPVASPPQVTTPGLSAAAPSPHCRRTEGEGGRVQTQCRGEMKLRATFDGDPEKLPIFLTRVATFMTKWTDSFADETDKVQHVADQLEGAAAEWLLALYDISAPELNNLDAFILALRSRFEDPLRKDKVRAKLMNLKQGSCSVQEYALEFRRLASQLPELNEAFRIQVFKDGLRPDLLEWVLVRGSPNTLMGWVDLAGKGEMVKEEIKRAWQKQPRKMLKKDGNLPRSRHRLDPGEKEQRWKLVLCLRCGGEGHLAVACAESRRKPAGHKPEESRQKGNLDKGRKAKVTTLAAKKQRHPESCRADPEDDASDCEEPSGNEVCLD